VIRDIQGGVEIQGISDCESQLRIPPLTEKPTSKWLGSGKEMRAG